MSEISVFHCQVVVYGLDEKGQEWIGLADETWAEMHIFMEPLDVSNYRIVAWIQDTGEVVLNSLLTNKCSWIPVDSDFIQFTDETHEPAGLCFLDQYQAVLTTKTISDILIKLGGTALEIPELGVKYLDMVNALEQYQLVHCLSTLQQKGIVSHEALLQAEPSAIQDWTSNPDDQLKFQQLLGIEQPSATPEATRNLSTIEEVAPTHENVMHIGSLSDDDDTEEEGDPDNSNNETVQVVDAPTIKPQRPKKTSITSTISSRSSSVSSQRLSLADFQSLEQAMAQQSTENQDHEHTNDCECHFLKNTFRTIRLAGNLSDSSRESSNDEISLPYQTKQEMHITYNEKYARYEGFPAAWSGINQQFGVPLEVVPKRRVSPYSARIPAVLEMMKQYLIENGGLEIEGIFRLAPDKDECQEVKQQINSGSFLDCEDLNILANLIKVWFRELPTGLFNSFTEKQILRVNATACMEDIIDVVESAEEPHRSLTYWLLDLMIQVVENEKVNKMSAKNMAIVLSPNLYSIESANPMAALTMSQTVATFTQQLLTARLKTRINS